MNEVLQSPRSVPVRGRIVDTVGWLLGSVAALSVAAASMPLSGWTSSPGAVTVAPASDIQPGALANGTSAPSATTRIRCQTCGIVETMHTVQAEGAAPAAYELTIRFRDGSRRLSRHSDDARWRVGDSIMLMGGAKLADRI